MKYFKNKVNGNDQFDGRTYKTAWKTQAKVDTILNKNDEIIELKIISKIKGGDNYA